MKLHLVISFILELQPHVRGWLLASADGTKMGIIPANYIKVIGKRRGTKSRPVPPTNNAAQLPAPQNNQQTVPENDIESVNNWPKGETLFKSQPSSMDSDWTEENTDPSKQQLD